VEVGLVSEDKGRRIQHSGKEEFENWTIPIKSEIRKLKSDSGDVLRPVRSAISDFGFEVQESSNFKIFF
jgi:hypothetical protein